MLMGLAVEPSSSLMASMTILTCLYQDCRRLRRQQPRVWTVAAMSVSAGNGRTDREIRHAFISYVREDSERVDWLQRRLEGAGVRVWRDTADLWPGEDWRARVRQAIRDDALVFIACFSEQSVARSRSYQNEELVLAIEQLRLRAPGEPWLLPVRFDDCRIPDLDIGGGRALANEGGHFV